MPTDQLSPDYRRLARHQPPAGEQPVLFKLVRSDTTNAQSGIHLCNHSRMRRYGMIIRLRPESEAAYRQYHQAVWPDVLKTISECNIRNYTIFLRDGYLFGYFEYTGNDYEADMRKMAADPATQRWWEIMEPMQDPLPNRAAGQWWAAMEEVFHHD